MFPLLSTWIIWVPVSAYLFYTAQLSQGLVVSLSHIFTTYYLCTPSLTALTFLSFSVHCPQNPAFRITLCLSPSLNRISIADQIFKLVPGGNTIFVGLSVFLGISAFGIVGAITGPLLAGIKSAILTIYKEYYFKTGSNGDEAMRHRRAHSDDFDLLLSPVMSPRGQENTAVKKRLF